MGEISTMSDLYPLMYNHLPGIDSFTLDQHLQQAAREFCDYSESWREELNRNLVAATCIYGITASWDCRIKKVLEVWIKTASDVTNGTNGTMLDPHFYSFSPATGTLTIDNSYKPSVAVTNGLVVKVVLVPQITQAGTNVLSQDFLNVWAEAIMYRAFFTLMKMPRQRWTNLDPMMGAPYYWREYNRKVSDAMTEVAYSNTTEPDGWSA
jgi:hypothetical protein